MEERAKGKRMKFVAEQTYYRWRKEYGDLQVDHASWSLSHATRSATSQRNAPTKVL